MPTSGWNFRWKRTSSKLTLNLVTIIILASASACIGPGGPYPRAAPAAQPVVETRPATVVTAPSTDEATRLLRLTAKVIGTASTEDRRAIERTQQARFEAAPTYDNLLGLSMVRAFTSALPADLQQTRADLQALANGRAELSENQRNLALLTLILVDDRLRMGGQIADLQQQIDSLTEIEASLNEADVNGAGEPMP